MTNDLRYLIKTLERHSAFNRDRRLLNCSSNYEHVQQFNTRLLHYNYDTEPHTPYFYIKGTPNTPD